MGYTGRKLQARLYDVYTRGEVDNKESTLQGNINNKVNSSELQGLVETYSPPTDLTGYSTTTQMNTAINNAKQIHESTTDPTWTSNKTLGTLWMNTNSGELFSCIDGTVDNNMWKRLLDNSTIARPEFVQATGGTITYDGNYKVHTFTSSGSLNVTALGNQYGGTEIEYLVIGGGGGGGREQWYSNNYGGAGGGGAGGYRNSYASELSGGNSSSETPLTPAVGSYAVTIGAGGGGQTSGTGNGASGNASSFGAITSLGGGYGGGFANGGAGGSGGGGGGGGNSHPSDYAGGSGSSGQGHNGSYGNFINQIMGVGGAGGGAGSTYAQQTGYANVRGAGLSSSITGTSVLRAQGGECAHGNGSSANGGSTGGVNTGTGGGGGAYRNGGSGGSGIVIVRYKYQN